MNKYIKLMIFVIGGAALGYAWYHFYACENGCPITSSWSNMTLIGALFGGIIGFPVKKKNQKETEIKEE